MLNKNLIVLYKNNLKFKELCIDMLSRQYAFSSNQIISYKDVLNFNESYLAYNKKVNWDIPTIEVVKDKIDWKGFYHINGLELDLTFFKTFEDYINFNTIHLNRNIDWSNELLDKYADKWDWNRLMMQPITASPRNISKYNDRYDWELFSSNWHLVLTEELIDTFKDNWNWVKLSSNSNLKLNKKGIEKYKEKLCFNGLSRNPVMVPFILAYPNDYNWNWNSFIQNPGVVFSYKLVKFLMTKLKAEMTILNSASEEMQNDFVLFSITSKICYNPNFDRTLRFSKKIPWKAIINTKPETLSTQELEKNIDLNEFDKVISSSIIKKLSKEYILKNKEALLKFRWSLFRYGAIDTVFVEENHESGDWFQLAFNEQFNWSLDFVIKYLEKFESNYGLSQNQRLYQTLFGQATIEEIEELIKNY